MEMQNKKKLLDTGEIGNAQSGDILFDGGNKLNSVIEDLYKVFGDRRLLVSAKGVDQMILHGTGYYQKLGRADYIQEVEPGQMHDISTEAGPLTIRLPTNAKAGERVKIQNYDGQWKQFPLSVDANTGGNIDGQQIQKYSQDFCEIQFVCVNDQMLNVRQWKALVTPLFGNNYTVVDDIFTVARDQSIQSQLYNIDEFTGMKLMVVGEELTNTSENTYKQTMEIMVLNDKEQVLSTEYAVLYTSPEKLFDITFQMQNNKSQVHVNVNQKQSKQLKVHIKSIEQIKI